MANNGAPVCNLPNIGQVPALQAGRLYPSIPRVYDLPTAIQALNTLAQIVAQLTSAGLPPFRNNLAPFTDPSRSLVGTQGISGAEGSDGSPSRAGKDGKEGKKAKDAKYHKTKQTTENVKVKGTEDNDDSFLILRRTTNFTLTSSVDGQKKIIWEGQISGPNWGGPIEMGQPLPAVGQSEGRPFTGTKQFNREEIDENTAFGSQGVNGCGIPARPYETGLMCDCVGVQWEEGLAVEFFE